MRRAEVWKSVYPNRWWTVVQGESGYLRGSLRIFPTHAEALTHALEQTGLTPTTNPDPTEAP